MNKKAAIANIISCILIGGIISYFSSAKWIASSLWVFAALFINGSIAIFEDARPGGFDNPNGNDTPKFTFGYGALNYWSVSILITLIALILGAYVQFKF